MDQLKLPFEGSTDSLDTEESFPLRPIYYLGSKLRMLDSIKKALDDVDPARGRTCDLFSGSGVVSSGLTFTRRVIAVDIQEYARVLSEALINPLSVPKEIISGIVAPLEDGDLGQKLSWAMSPLVTAEEQYIHDAARGELAPLYDLLEAGSIVRAQVDGVGVLPRSCQDLFSEVLDRLREVDLLESRDSTAARYYGGLYFGFEQAIKMDLILSRANTEDDKYRDVDRKSVV